MANLQYLECFSNRGTFDTSWTEQTWKLVCLDSQILVGATPSLARTKKVILLCVGKRGSEDAGGRRVFECCFEMAFAVFGIYISFSGRSSVWDIVVFQSKGKCCLMQFILFWGELRHSSAKDKPTVTFVFAEWKLILHR